MRSDPSMSSDDGSAREREVVERVPKQLFIGGEWRDGAGGETFAVEDPATGETLCEVADATPDDAHAPRWTRRPRRRRSGRATPPRERGEILRRASRR